MARRDSELERLSHGDMLRKLSMTTYPWNIYFKSKNYFWGEQTGCQAPHERDARAHIFSTSGHARRGCDPR